MSAPVFINSVDQAVAYLRGNGLAVRQLNSDDARRVWQSLNQRLMSVLDSLPQGPHKPSSVEAAGYGWHLLDAAGHCTSESLSEYLEGYAGAAIAFEDLPDVAFRATSKELAAVTPSNADVYIMPWPQLSWVYALSHEGEPYGPYFFAGG